MRNLFFTLCGILFAIPFAIAEPYDEQLGSKIDTYLAGKGSPISGNGDAFFTSGVTYNVDPRLIVAIAGAESSFGTQWAACPASGFNAWSWFYNGNCHDSPFSSFADGIQTVTKFMRRSYLNKGRISIPLIEKKYCASGCDSWVPNVTKFYTELGGDTTALTFARTLIDFEEFTAPPFFSQAQPPLTIGIATFSGGQLLNAATSLPVDRSTVYGTADFCVACQPAITIDFSRRVSGFSLFLMNGLPFTVTYTVQDDLGTIQTVTLVANLNSGAQTVKLPDKGIIQVIITGDNSTSWDFLIDNVQFAPL